MNSKISDIIIVGSGLAGTVTLVQELLKIAAEPSITPRTPVNITVLERHKSQQFSGVAYGTTAHYSGFNLNLTAKRATPFMADAVPDGFPTFPDYILKLSEQASDNAEKEKILDYLQNPPRELFGRYLGHIVDVALEKAGGKANVTMRTGEALDMDVTGKNPRLIIEENGINTVLEGKHIVLATGQREVLRPPFLDDMVDSPLYLDDIYGPNSTAFYDKMLKNPQSDVLVVGTALSASDAALRLLKSGYQGHITMISRNGLEHAGYGATNTQTYLEHSLIGEPRPEKQAELALRAPRFMHLVEKAQSQNKSEDTVALEHKIDKTLQREFGALMKRGYTAEEVLGYWERYIPDIAEVLSDESCGNLYNKYATWMGVHRVGTTPDNTRILKEAELSGQLEIISGFISAEEGHKIRQENGKVVIEYMPTKRTERAGINGGTGTLPQAWDSAWHNNQESTTRSFDYILSGLGYIVTYNKSRDPFWKNLIDKGMVTAHKKSGDGIELDTNDLTVLDSSGNRVENVTAVGIPAFGATMYGRFPHPENPGVYGGRILPFTANIVGITGGVIKMVDELHRNIMGKRDITVQSVLEQDFTGSVHASKSTGQHLATRPDRGLIPQAVMRP